MTAPSNLDIWTSHIRHLTSSIEHLASNIWTPDLSSRQLATPKSPGARGHPARLGDVRSGGAMPKREILRYPDSPISRFPDAAVENEAVDQPLVSPLANGDPGHRLREISRYPDARCQMLHVPCPMSDAHNHYQHAANTLQLAIVAASR
jgi:hypothetical protein